MERLTVSSAITQKDIDKLMELSDENQFGRNAAYYKLQLYEDLEEQGLLVKLPCPVGSHAYHVIQDKCADPQIYISEHEITNVSANAIYFADDWWTFEEMKELNVFLTQAEAEAKLEEMEGGVE